MSTELKPDVRQMLEVAQACDLNTLNEAYGNYLNHYDCFFLIEKYHEQHAEFVKELTKLGFVVQLNDTKKVLVDISITEALEKLNAYEAANPAVCKEA